MYNWSLNCEWACSCYTFFFSCYTFCTALCGVSSGSCDYHHFCPYRSKSWLYWIWNAAEKEIMISAFDLQDHGNLILTLLDYKMYNCDTCCFNKPKRIELLKEISDPFLCPSWTLQPWDHQCPVNAPGTIISGAFCTTRLSGCKLRIMTELSSFVGKGNWSWWGR